MVPGGLSATYYNDRTLAEPLSAREFVAVGEAVGTIANYVGVRWRGYLSPTRSDSYTFHLLTSSSTQFSLYDTAHEPLLSIRSDSGSADAITGSRYLTNGQLYLIDVVYWHVTGVARLKLQVTKSWNPHSKSTFWSPEDWDISAHIPLSN